MHRSRRRYVPWNSRPSSGSRESLVPVALASATAALVRPHLLGAALGGIEANWFPSAGVGFWPLVSKGAMLGSTMRSPFTAVVFLLELTHDVNGCHLPWSLVVPRWLRSAPGIPSSGRLPVE